jgi:hypothetical protein
MSILQSFIAGQEARRQADAAAEINRMQQFLSQNGQAIFQGDQNALGALAGMGAQGLETAMGLRNAQEERAARQAAQERETVLQGREDQTWKLKLEERAASLDAATREAERAQLAEGLAGAAYFHANGDQQGYTAFLQQNGIDPAQFPFESFPAHAARFKEVLEVYDKFKPEVAEPADEYQRYVVEEQAAGRQPLDRISFEQAKKGRGFAMTLPDGTTVEMGGGMSGAAPVGQNPAATATPRDPSRLARGLSDADTAEITRNRELAQSAGDLESIANQMEVLTPKLGYTGPGGKVYGFIDDVVGVLPGDSGARGSFRSLSTEAQLTFTAKTKGAITEREMATFAEAVPSLSQTPEGNKAISQVLRAGAQRVQARAQFLEEYAAANGSLQGAQAAWQKFMQDNPIISQGEAGNLVVKGDGDWRSYITPNLNPADSASGPGQTMAGDIDPGAIEILRQNNTPEYRKFFDEVFGPGSAERVLGGN